jgi:hypothetical protein
MKESPDFPKTAIIDGDIIAYRAAFWADGEGVDELPGRIATDIKAWTPKGIERVVIALSCPREVNFRRDLWPLYKQHREGAKSPDCMGYALELLWDQQDSTPNSTITTCVDRLEADDLIGIMVSSNKAVGITVDKDLRQVPGWHWNPDKEEEPVYVNQEDADRFFYQQWITGDSTDNVWGLWKVGPAKAKKILDNTDPKDWDQTIMDLYLNEDWDKRPEDKRPDMSKEEFAIAQATCVRILRSGDYNKETCEVSLWHPKTKHIANGESQ